MKTKMSLIGTALLLTAGAVTGCGGGAGGTPSQDQPLVIGGEQVASQKLWKQAHDEGTFTLYSAYAEDKDKAVMEAFTHDTGIDVELVHLPTPQLLTRLRSEAKGGKQTADVVKAGNEALVQSLSKDKTLVPYTVPSSDKLQPHAVSSGGAYTAWVQSPFTIGYNSAKVPASQVPTKWADLLDPKWKGKIGIPDFAAGGTEIALYQFLRNKVDPHYWSKLAKQKPTILPGIAPTVDSLTRGEFSIAPVIPANLSAPLGHGAPVGFVKSPAEGLPVFSNFVGLAGKAQHAAAAKVYINWLLSKRGQNFVATLGEYPVRTDANAPAVEKKPLPSRGAAKIYEPNRADVITKTQEWTDQWDAAFHFSR